MRGVATYRLLRLASAWCDSIFRAPTLSFPCNLSQKRQFSGLDSLISSKGDIIPCPHLSISFRLEAALQIFET